MIDILEPMNGGRYEWPISATLADRFQWKVDRSGECWRWIAFLNPRGYGMVRNAGRMALAHRVAWALERGEIPVGMQVLHHCDNPACVRVDHLYLGSNADNIRDKVSRGRSSFPQPKKRGESHHGAKLTAASVKEIRAAEGVTLRSLAARFGVSPSTITLIRQKKLWAHLS